MNWQVVWQQTTNFGDLAVVLPGSMVVFLALFFGGAKPTAWRWAMTIGFCGMFLLAAKLVCVACYPTLWVSNLHSPSGHSGLSACFYGSLAMIATSFRPRWASIAVQSLCFLLVALVAVSRIELGAHSVIEVIVGLIIGAGVAAISMRTRAPATVRSWTLVVTFLGVMAVALLLNGQKIHAERSIGLMAGWLSWSHVCPA